jgi:hypothetical protein
MVEPTLRVLRNQTASTRRRSTREDVHVGLSMLHCLLPPDYESESEMHRVHRGHLRETVYTDTNFTVLNDWGPFTPEGGVDWRLLDAISTVMSE